MKRLLPFLPLLIAGCSLTHMPPDRDPVHTHIRWHNDFEAAESASKESNRPVLVCLIAGDLVERC